jgi:AcrR family transcriptional regulator
MPKIVNVDEKRKLICEKAYEQFLVSGINNFSLTKFIASLNMSKGLFYYYFQTKEELIFKVIKNKEKIIFDEIEKKISEAETFYDKLLALFSFYLDSSIPENLAFTKLVKDIFYMYINVKNKFIAQKNAEYYNYRYTIIDRIFTEMIDKGYLKKDSKKFIISLIAISDGMHLQSITLDNYDLNGNLINYIKILDDLLKYNNS